MIPERIGIADIPHHNISVLVARNLHNLIQARLMRRRAGYKSGTQSNDRKARPGSSQSARHTASPGEEYRLQ